MPEPTVASACWAASAKLSFVLMLFKKDKAPSFHFASEIGAAGTAAASTGAEAQGRPSFSSVLSSRACTGFAEFCDVWLLLHAAALLLLAARKRGALTFESWTFSVSFLTWSATR